MPLPGLLTYYKEMQQEFMKISKMFLKGSFAEGWQRTKLSSKKGSCCRLLTDYIVRRMCQTRQVGFALAERMGRVY